MVIPRTSTFKIVPSMLSGNKYKQKIKKKKPKASKQRKKMLTSFINKYQQTKFRENL